MPGENFYREERKERKEKESKNICVLRVLRGIGRLNVASRENGRARVR